MQKKLACQICINEACTLVKYFENEGLNHLETVSGGIVFEDNVYFDLLIIYLIKSLFALSRVTFIYFNCSLCFEFDLLLARIWRILKFLGKKISEWHAILNKNNPSPVAFKMIASLSVIGNQYEKRHLLFLI